VSFSAASVTHSFENADGTPASGVIEFSLTARIANNGISIAPNSVTYALDSSGNLNALLTSNVDAATVPQTTQWRVDFRILGAPLETDFIIVPSGGGSVDLGSLLPAAQQVA
jgi:hypothetical protein